MVLGLFGPLLPSLGLLSSSKSSSPELACCMRYISFSKSCLQKSCPARRTNCSPFCKGWQQTTQTKHGRWKTCCWARITISWGRRRSPQREHLTPNILYQTNGKIRNVFIANSLSLNHKRGFQILIAFFRIFSFSARFLALQIWHSSISKGREERKKCTFLVGVTMNASTSKEGTIQNPAREFLACLSEWCKGFYWIRTVASVHLQNIREEMKNIRNGGME